MPPLISPFFGEATRDLPYLFFDDRLPGADFYCCYVTGVGLESRDLGLAKSRLKTVWYRCEPVAD